MKQCPTCQAEYPDEFKFCRNDATLLVVVGEVGAKQDSALPKQDNLSEEDRAKRWLLKTGGLLSALLAGIVVVGVIGWYIWQRTQTPTIDTSNPSPTAPTASASSSSGRSSSPDTTSEGKNLETAATMPGERFPQTRRGIMSEGKINALNYSDTRYALNEVYARHGYSFVDKAIYGRFRTMTWYRPESKLTSEEAETRFTSIEKENSRKLGSHRDALAARGLKE
jgi:hypothetical protein